MGFVHIYCGDGKGKTTAAIGLAVRMAGSGGHAVIARFLKNDESGEVAALGCIPGIEVLPCEKSFGFTWQMTAEQKKEAGAYYEALFKKAAAKAGAAAGEKCKTAAEKGSGSCPNGGASALLVLDEVCAAVNAGLLREELVTEFLDSRPEYVEVVLTGREPAESFKQRAGYISRIEKEKHPFDAGVAARKGIEY